MLPLVRNVPNVFMACYQIDCFLKIYYLFAFACAGSVAVCKRSRNGEWGLLPSCAAARFGGLLWRVGLSSCGVQAPARRGAWAPELVGSVVACGLSCSVA